jgi:hypothetical protein
VDLLAVPHVVYLAGEAGGEVEHELTRVGVCPQRCTRVSPLDKVLSIAAIRAQLLYAAPSH